METVLSTFYEISACCIKNVYIHVPLIPLGKSLLLYFSVGIIFNTVICLFNFKISRVEIR